MDQYSHYWLNAFGWAVSPEDDLHKPISTADDKWKLLPAFLKAKGLVRQHIDSYNHFVNVQIHQILRANELVLSESDPNWYLRYTKIRIGEPAVQEDQTSVRVTPNECRLRDVSYTAPIYVDIEYLQDGVVKRQKDKLIGRMPVMLRSSLCVLSKPIPPFQAGSPQALAEMKECPHDPGGYFIVKGVEKVILTQEQLSKNRIIVETDRKDQLCATVTSSTLERKSKTDIILTRDGRFAVHNNLFATDIPVFVMLKAMGMESDQEIVQLIGAEFEDMLGPSLADCHQEHKVFNDIQALAFIGARMKTTNPRFKSRVDSARDTLASSCILLVYGSLSR